VRQGKNQMCLNVRWRFSDWLVTGCIRIVADYGTRIFQVTTNLYAGYNVHIYYYFGYYFYTLLATGIILIL